MRILVLDDMAKKLSSETAMFTKQGLACRAGETGWGGWAAWSVFAGSLCAQSPMVQTCSSQDTSGSREPSGAYSPETSARQQQICGAFLQVGGPISIVQYRLACVQPKRFGSLSPADLAPTGNSNLSAPIGAGPWYSPGAF